MATPQSGEATFPREAWERERKKLDNLAAATAVYLAYYNYCWRCRYPDKSGRSGQKRPTAAMAAKLTGHIWSFAELFETVMPAKVAA